MQRLMSFRKELTRWTLCDRQSNSFTAAKVHLHSCIRIGQSGASGCCLHAMVADQVSQLHAQPSEGCQLTNEPFNKPIRPTISWGA